MKNFLLLDTHILIWLLYSPELIREKTKEAIQNADIVYVSQVSFWEIAIKHRIGKLSYDPAEIIRSTPESGLEILNISQEHIAHYSEVGIDHKDPYDLLLLSQTEVENIKLVSYDNVLETKRPDLILT